MTKISNQYSLTNILTADLANSRLGINNVSPTVALDVTGAGKFSGSVTSDDLLLTAGTLFSAGNTGFSNRLSDTTLYLQMPATGFNITDNALNTRFILSSTGAATFSSSVTSQANGSAFGTASATGRALIIQAGSTNQAIMFKNAANGDGTIYAYGTSTSLDYAFNTYSVANAFYITNAGNVGIGTSSPSAKFHVAGTAANTVSYVSDTTGYALYQVGNTGGGLYYGIDSSTASGFANGAYSRHIYSGGAYPLIISTNDVERMRITSGGEVLVGTTTTDVNTVGVQLRPTGLGIFVRSGASCLQLNRTTSDGIIASFRTSDVERGSISIAGSVTSYNTSSDYRLKEDLKDYNGLNIISKLKTYDFKWKDASIRDYGMMAHELQEVLPYAVTGVKDGKDMQGVDYSKIVPVMLKAIQELSAKVSLLENK